ncbi:MAG: S16 family serine protease [Trueperella sp.]|nr:S16 family serine protease [Trueperella sp.]
MRAWRNSTKTVPAGTVPQNPAQLTAASPEIPLADSTDAPAARGKRRRRPGRRRAAASVLFSILLVAALLLPTGYLTQKSGPAIDVTKEFEGQSLVEISEVATYDSDTDFLLTTVSATGSADRGVLGGTAFLAAVNPEIQLLPVRMIYPANVTSQQVKEQNAQLMDNSQNVADLVALEAAGFAVSMKITITAAVKDSSAAKVVKPGDIITGLTTPEKSIDIQTFAQMSQVLSATAPGTEIKLRVERDGKELTLPLTTLPYQPDETGWTSPGSLLGVLVKVEDVQIPAQVKYLIDGIGGPSAGTIFALSIYDAVTPGSLGGSARIAGTGAITWSGEVTPIGGVEHKMRGAVRAGATDFIAPAANCQEVVGNVPAGLTVWAVRDFSAAVEAATAIGAGDDDARLSCEAVLSAGERQ